jgi:hydrogenase-4 component E
MNLLPGWMPHSNTVNLLAGAFLLSALFVTARRRQMECIAALRLNALALSAIALLKAVLVPMLLARRARTEPTEVRAIGGIPGGALVSGALVVLAFSQTRTLFGSRSDILASCLPISVAGTLVGLFVMVTRRQALMQVVGLVLVENAIFLAAVSLTYGMPLVVETGVLLDLLVGLVVLGLFVERLAGEHGERDTSRMRRLRG